MNLVGTLREHARSHPDAPAILDPWGRGTRATTFADLDRLSSKAAARLARGAYHVLPDLSAFDVKTEVVHGLPVTMGYIGSTAVYGLAYVAALLLISAFIFSRRDFK